MKHFGDITKINGADVPIVDIITGGSPCQDLSIAGKRAGLEGERSGLFMEQIRIIKEMRNESRRTNNDFRCIRPRFMVWENVPGAFSSNGGEDFRIVLEETARVTDQTAVIPRLENEHKWSPSGCILGNGWSIAWRVHDAQFWGVAQRRKRVALVADFGGTSAPEILFERKDLSGYSEQSLEQREAIATTITEGSNPTSNDPKPNLKCYKKTAHANNAEGGQGWTDTEVNDTLNAFDIGEVRTPIIIVEGLQPGICRRLSPKEYERLQGFPDGWTDIGEWVDSKGKKHDASDMRRYKALGNSIALPFWQWLAVRMVQQLGKDHPTMASLFDGIGGFPLVYSRCDCLPAWASEIEEFPIAVTKYHFGEE